MLGKLINRQLSSLKRCYEYCQTNPEKSFWALVLLYIGFVALSVLVFDMNRDSYKVLFFLGVIILPFMVTAFSKIQQKHLESRK